MEGGNHVEQNLDTSEVVVMISGAEEGSKMGKQNGDSKVFDNFEAGSSSFSNYLPIEPPVVQLLELDNLRSRKEIPPSTSFSSLEITKLSPALMKSPKVPDGSVTRQRSLTRSRPKSRLVEPAYPSSWKLAEGNTRRVPPRSPYRSSPNTASSAASTPKEKLKTAQITPKTPLMTSPGRDYNYDDDDEDDGDDVYTTGILHVGEKEVKKLKLVALIEWISFLCIMVFLIASFTIHKLRNSNHWSLELWKWCVLVLVIFCGRLFTEWIIHILVFAIERNFLLKRKVLYFVYSLKTSVRVFIWFGLILLAWALLINRGVKRSKRTSRILNYITRALACSLIGAAMWVVKTFLVKLFASSFHVNRFFDRIQESIFHQYVLQTLSGPPLMEDAENIGGSRASGQLCFKSMKKGKQKGKEEEVIDVEKLQKMKREKVSAWTMGGLIKVIGSSGLYTLSDALDESDDDDDDEGAEQKGKMITDECEAKAAASRIFKHVAKPGHKYIDEEDLLRFLNLENADNVLPLFEGAVETGKIKKLSFCNWVVKVYKERKCLTHSLNDTKTAIEELHKVFSGIVFVVILIVWVHLMGFATTQVLLFISSQLLLLVFMFGNSCKTAFEAIIFIFVMHPFDVGDRCVIDGVQMVVEEMNILTTIFLRYDNEKIFYPNSVLATKAISNFNRSPDMSDSVEFAIDVSTTAESIAALKARIKAYLESKPENWRPGHSVQIKEIEKVNKMRIALSVTHTMNFQNYGEKSNRRSELVFKLKNFFEELGIKYHLLPQEVHTRYVGSATPTATTVTL